MLSRISRMLLYFLAAAKRTKNLFGQDYMRYVLVAVVEAVLIAALTCGVFVEVLLGFAVKAVSEKIVGGF